MIRAGLLFFALFLASAVFADEPPVLVIPPGAEAGPDFDVDRATQAWIDTLSVEQRARSDAYFEGGYVLQVVDWIYALGVAGLLLLTPLSRRMRALSERVGGRGFLGCLVYAAQYIAVVWLLTFPLSVYEDFHREHGYGMATHTFGGWLSDELKMLAIAVVFGSPFIAAVFLVFRRKPRTWWLPATGLATAYATISLIVSPVYLAPMFNDYKPLSDGPLRERILSLARANGVPAHDVYWFDASRQTKRISANVSGLFGTTRISLNDNLLNRSPRESIEAVMGHEMGHYVLHHTLMGLIAGLLIAMVGLALTARVFDRIVARWGGRVGVQGIGDLAGFPLLVAILATWVFLMTPVTNSITRTIEAEADAFGLASSRQPDGFAQVAMQLSEYRKIKPGTWEEILFFDHPSGWNRVHRAMAFKKENP